MGANVQLNVESQDAVDRSCGRGHDENVERGMFMALAGLINVETNLVWDPVNSYFSLTGEYRIHKYKSGGGAVFDPYDQEIFLTKDHIDLLFEIAKIRMRQLSRGRVR